MHNPVLNDVVGRQLVTRSGAAPYLQTTNDANQKTEFIQLHVMTKNVQSIRDECRFQDFVAELDTCDFDLCLACETWRVELQDCIVTPSGCNIFLAGGDDRKGVGIAASNRLMLQMSDVTFHAYSSRICMLQFFIGNAKSSFISCYFPTSWDEDGEIEIMYDLLQLVVANARNTGSKIVVARDFNACIGSLRVDEDTAGVGEWGLGPRNTRGDAMVSWVLANGFSAQPTNFTTPGRGVMDMPEDNGWCQSAARLYFGRWARHCATSVA